MTAEKIKRPASVTGRTTRVRLTCGNLYVTVNELDGKMFEVFATLGKSGGCTASQMTTLTTSITMGIRHGVPPQVYIDKLVGSHCPVLSWDDGTKYLSCPDAIGQVMEAELKKMEEASKK